MVTVGSNPPGGADVLARTPPSRRLMDMLSPGGRRSEMRSPPKKSPPKLAALWRSASLRWPVVSSPPLSLRKAAFGSSNNECLLDEPLGELDKPMCCLSLSCVSSQPQTDDDDEDESESESEQQSEGPESKEDTFRPATLVTAASPCTTKLELVDRSLSLTLFSDETQAKRASLLEELADFRSSYETNIRMFPDYLPVVDKLLLQRVAKELELGCQVGDKSVAVFKRAQSLSGPPAHVRARLRLSTVQLDVAMPSSNSSNNNDESAADGDDMYVDISALAQQGGDSFQRMPLRRLDSGGGLRRKMLWDVAQLSSSSDVMTDRVTDGEGGVYAVQSRSSGLKLAMFKPVEEERFVRDGLTAGEGAVREEAAYVLDSRVNGFSGVPPTAVARLKLPAMGDAAKQGSVQRFMASSIGSMESYGMPFDLDKAQQFVPVEQVHRIGVLDVRVFNTDRHHGNILLIGDKPPYTMVPIDHGCILPSWFHMSEARFDWLEYPQSRVPFSPLTLAHIEALDADEDAAKLRKLGIREECIATMKICTLFLQLAARHGKTLHWIGSFMQRDGCFENASGLEKVVQRASAAVSIPLRFERNEFGEEKSSLPLGVLSRRPPSQFYRALELLMLEEIDHQG